MNIDVSLRLSDELKSLDISKVTGSEIAKGYCEIANTIKFPVKVMKYTDKNDGNLKMFVSYPQKKNGDKYNDIIIPASKEIKAEVQNAVLKEMSSMLSKEHILTENVTDVKVNFLKEPIRTGGITINAMASITLCGFIINGVQIKESERGLFVQMPQHKVGNSYHDTVYGTNKLIQQEIRNKVLEAYNNLLEKTPQISKEPEKDLEERSLNPFDEPQKISNEMSAPPQAVQIQRKPKL